MSRWTPVPTAGGAYADDSLPWSSQDTVNYIPVMAEKEGTRSAAILRGLPGCTTFSVTGSNAPIRGVRNVEGKLLAASGTTLFQIGTNGAATSLGTIPGVGRVSITHNQVAGGNEVVIGNGQSGYVYNTGTGVLAQITSAAFPGFKACDFIDSYIAGVEPNGRYWFISDLAGAMLYNSLDRQEAEAQPDRIVSLIVSHREVFVLGERTGQFFANTGAGTGTFQNRQGVEMDVGCAGTHAVAKTDNTVFFMGHDGIFYRLEGYQPVRKSTHALEQAWSRSDLSQAFFTVFEDRGHKVVYVNCPDGKTWGYDVATGEWHRRKSDGLDRWRMNTLTYWNRRWIAGDYSNGRLYQLDWAIQHEAGAELERRRIFPVMHDHQNRLTVNAIEFVFDTGLSAASNPLPTPLLPALKISGDLPNGMTGAAITPFTYAVSGGVLPYGNRTISVPALPTGLSMSTAGVVTGTPTVAATVTWTVSVTDADGTVATVGDSATLIDPAIAVAHLTTPFITAYPWSTAGFGVKFANPDTLPVGDGYGVALHPAGSAIAVGHLTTPFITAYPWSSAGFGVKFANPATLPAGSGYNLAFSPAGDALAVAHQTTPFVSAYPWSSAGFGVKFANPATLPTGLAYGVAFSPAGDAIAVSHNLSPFVSVYAWSTAGFGVKFTNPATLPGIFAYAVAFSPSGAAIAVAENNTPFIHAYAWSSSGFGTKFTNPATLPAGVGYGVAFSPASDAIAVGHTTTPFITAYPWSSAGFGTKFTNPATLPAGDGSGVAFNSAGSAIAVAHNNTPFVSAYAWSSAGFGAKFTNPATLPGGNGRGVAFL